MALTRPISPSSTLELGGKRDALIAVAQRNRSHFETQQDKLARWGDSPLYSRAGGAAATSPS